MCWCFRCVAVHSAPGFGYVIVFMKYHSDFHSWSNVRTVGTYSAADNSLAFYYIILYELSIGILAKLYTWISEYVLRRALPNRSLSLPNRYHRRSTYDAIKQQPVSRYITSCMLRQKSRSVKSYRPMTRQRTIAIAQRLKLIAPTTRRNALT